MREQRENNKPNGVPDSVIRSKAPVKARKPKDKMFGNKIKFYLVKIGMSQQELADIALNGNAPFLTRIIRGQKNELSLTTAFKISRALGQTIENVFIFNEEDQEDDN